MIVTQKALPRRTVLRGLGASLALPLLDGMVPAFAALRTTAAAPVRRLGVVYVPNGMMMPHWTPPSEGAGFEFPTILEPLEPYRSHVQVLSGMHGVESEGPHARSSTRFLTGVPSKPDDGSDLRGGVSMDQLAGRVHGRETQLATLELALDGRDLRGVVRRRLQLRLHQHHHVGQRRDPRCRWRTTRGRCSSACFGDTGSTDPAIRRARLARDASLLDSVTDRAADLSRQLGAWRPGQARPSTLDAVRDIERRIRMAEAQSDRELAGGGPARRHPRQRGRARQAHVRPDGPRLGDGPHAGRDVHDGAGDHRPDVRRDRGVPDAHHPISHHQRDPEKLAKLTKINQYHVQLFSAFVDRLANTPDGDGTLLDRSMIVYGAGMGDSNAHASTNLPILLAGGGAGTGGRHVKYPADTPLANLHLSLLDKMGVPIEQLGHSNGRLPLEPLSGV